VRLSEIKDPKSLRPLASEDSHLPTDKAKNIAETLLSINQNKTPSMMVQDAFYQTLQKKGRLEVGDNVHLRMSQGSSYREE
jgi:hypothetical protein